MRLLLWGQDGGVCGGGGVVDDAKGELGEGGERGWAGGGLWWWGRVGVWSFQWAEQICPNNWGQRGCDQHCLTNKNKCQK